MNHQNNHNLSTLNFFFEEANGIKVVQGIPQPIKFTNRTPISKKKTPKKSQQGSNTQNYANKSPSSKA